MSSEHTTRSQHLYDSIAEQKHAVVDSFADQREVLKRAVAEQRLAAMPEDMRRTAMGASAHVSAEIVEALQKIIAREVTRQLDLALCAMIEQSARAHSTDGGSGGAAIQK
ncbi:hypothetical protein [Brevundimonas sp.]|jgi:hypothetical protein|uniref:hypothetical protein n=1 Tax=Brevundimonas sp. TaxID=1871086 RepID=UPI0037C097BE